MTVDRLRVYLLTALATMLYIATSDSALAESEEVQPEIKRPGYSALRQNDDWSVLAGHDTKTTGDWFDRIKYIPLSDDGEIWLSLGGQLRIRLESWENFGFGGANDDEFTLYRALVHADLHLGPNVRFFVEGKGAFSDDRQLPGGNRTLDVDELALQQMFFDVKVPLADDHSVTFRLGRQEFLFGNQRLVSPLPWANTLRHWDGVSVIYKGAGWKATGFYTHFVPVDKFDFNEPDAQTEFWGVYATGKFPCLEAINLDLYYLGLSRENQVTFNGTTGTEDRHTVGGRIWGKIGDTAFDYELEGAYQFGNFAQADISAYMVAAELGYSFTDVPTGPRVYIGFDYASGDDSPGGDVETFNQLFPLGHKYLGYIDIIGRQNIVDLSYGVKFKPHKKFIVMFQQHFFWRAEKADGVYNAGGGLVRAGNATFPGGSRYLGSEIDITVTYKHNAHLKLQAGYSHFFAKSFIGASGANSDIDFAYFQTIFNF